MSPLFLCWEESMYYWNKELQLLTLFVGLMFIAFFIGLEVISSANSNAGQEYNKDKYIDQLQEDLRSYRDANTFELTATAYTARKKETNENPGKTAIMEEPVPGWTVAVSQDLKRWLGKKVYVEGHGVFRVNDLMNKRYEKRIDILKPTVEAANDFGKKIVEVVLVPN